MVKTLVLVVERCWNVFYSTKSFVLSIEYVITWRRRRTS